MNIKKKRGWELPESAATPESVYTSRRRFVKALGIGTVAGTALATCGRYLTRGRIEPTAAISGFSINNKFRDAGRSLTSDDTVYRFNNFYEFSVNKAGVWKKCRNFRLDPWSLTIDGLVKKPLQLSLDDILNMPLEQRVYRFRCVEAWAMTVPWVGLPLARLLQRAEPDSQATYLRVESFFDPHAAPRQRIESFPWPYVEGLTIQEAMNPLAFAAVGLYGRYLQPQCGSPMRVVLPWKYGYKGPKSVVRLTAMRFRPATFWNTLQPQEYGFVGNVNPELSHPRWSQKTETLLGTWGKRVRTEKFNGYGEWVGNLYLRDER